MSELIAAAHARSGRVNCRPFGRNEGVHGLSASMNFRPGAMKTPDGRLWFATAQGVVSIDPSRMARELPPVPVLIEEVRVNGVPQQTGPTLRVSAGAQRVDFRFAALSYTAPESVALRHRLDGIDREWVETSRDRRASYASLPAGSYRLRVTASNSAGQWNKTETTLVIVVVPAWWETLAFRIVLSVVAAALIALIARHLARRGLQRRFQRLERENALEKERSRIARDLHDDLGASLTEVSLIAEALTETGPPEMATQLQRLASRTRRLSTDLSSIIWTMNTTNTTLDRFAAFVRRYAERLFRYTTTRCLVTGVDGIPAIPVEPHLQHQLLAVTKEALNNILRHAHATETQIDLRCDGTTFEISIRDNGVGFNPEAAAEAAGNGLRNMRSRAADLRGELEIAASPGGGTILTLRIALASCRSPLPSP
jgi:signal transduction histidine kinase